MLQMALRLIAEGEASSSEQLARRLAVSSSVAGDVLGQLARLGYLRPSGVACDKACSGCAQGTACFVPARVWALTEKGRRAAQRPAGEAGSSEV